MAPISRTGNTGQRRLPRSQAPEQDHLPSAREFADMVAHELNTPLNAAAITAQLLEYAEAGIHAAEARRLAALIRRNLARANEVLRDVRAAALQGERRWSARTLPFGQVLGEVLAELGEEQHASGVHIEVEDSVPAIRVDAARMRIVLSNLLRNAIKYCDPARAARWVRINFHRQSADGMWWTYVRDNGLGVPAAYIDSVFERNFRAHPDRAEGTGLGLTIVRQEVAALGGMIECSSEPGVGTTIRFSVPESGAAT